MLDRFLRVDIDRSREGGGAGIGLAIAAEIVSTHNGTVGIDETGGCGALVTVPLRRAAASSM